MQRADYVVVGAGLAGAATAWRLAASGHDVAVLERDVPASAAGSSHGSARIFRYAYADPFYAAAVAEAKKLWDGLEAAADQQLLTSCGAVDYGAGRSPRELAAVLDGIGVEHSLLSGEEASERWPGLVFDTDVLWQPGAGVIDAESTVNAMVGLAVAAGARLHNSWVLQNIARHGSGYRLTSKTGETFDAGHVVVSVGGWLPQVLQTLALPSSFTAALPRITVRQEQAFHFPYRDQATAPSWPTIIHNNNAIEVYALPGGRDAGFAGQKVAEYNGGGVIGSAAEQSGLVDPDNRERVTDYVRRYLPGLEPTPYAETTCLFTNTPDGEFIIDRVDGITVLSPCSGHGAKFAPLIGQWAADLATAPQASIRAGMSPVPLRFRPSRAGSSAVGTP